MIGEIRGGRYWYENRCRRERTLGAEELARDVERFAANNDNLLAVQELLGHGGGQATKEVTLAVDDDLGEERC